ncbi:hypothetical protein D0Z07_2527 [Hyphodiscus hymeniophilus]|uniref:Uncharacterized protein n=1 Tax=Hyphodiscus hymeniophilus TaxID=353542 RepID=A0A9P6VNY8_9HELO|nr:hypothetical protein D0Z07_2527 [Hyphodiscus hymeniophilus]
MEDDSDDEEPQVESDAEPHQPPRISEWRANLVALSQVENLYFAAYQDKIHVTIPQGLKQTIRSIPDLIIDLPTSKDGLLVGGYLDRLHGHSVNHIITGNLGALELLLVACDDGDILAYYTHSILAAIKTPGTQSSLRPFFHENVGISAWGLAIHSQSRSSNAREVVVYHFGCADAGTVTSIAPACEAGGDKSSAAFSEQVQLVESDPTLFPTASESLSKVRGLNFRRILKLGKEGHNIPCVDFSSDLKGEARSVLATDIHGNLWILSIWRDGNSDDWVKRIPSMQKPTDRGMGIMGWGVLALPLHAFKRMATPEQALGAFPCELQSVCSSRRISPFRNFCFDTSSTISKVDISDKSSFHPAYGYGMEGPDTIPTVFSREVTAGLGNFSSVTTPVNPREDVKIVPDPVFLDMSRRIFVSLINNPKLEESTPIKSESVRAREGRLESLRPRKGLTVKAHKEQKVQNALESDLDAESQKPFNGPVYRLQDQSAILRTYQDDIELIPPCETMPVTFCQKVLRQGLPVSIVHQVNFERLIFHILIAELGLVVVGSQVGRVALVSLTRPEDSFSWHGPATMFKVEHILPTYTHEAQGFRPSVPLLGIAASPLQGQRKERKIWRLIMQYYDHSILSYDLRRDGDHLLVV